MARTDHGISLAALVEQPGASFRITKSGSDTGTRTFMCDRALAAALAPAKGSADYEFPSMVVEDVDISFTRNGLAQLSVTYTGTVKDPTTTPETQTGIIYRMNAQVDFYEVGSVEYQNPHHPDEPPVTGPALLITKYIPTVSHRYTTNTFPTFQVGQYIAPPAHADKLPPTSYMIPDGAFAGYRVTFFYSDAGWRLHNRDVNTTGNSHEVDDAYLYDYKVRSILVSRGNEPPTNFNSFSQIFAPPR